jgi:site-specific recombinase
MSVGDMLEGVFEASKSLPLYRQSAWDATQLGDVPYMNITLIFAVIVFVLEYYLDIRQTLAFYTHLSLAPELKGHITDETFKKSTAYNKDKFSFKMVESLFMFLEGIALILLGYLPYAWDLSTHLAESSGICGLLGLGALGESALFSEILVTFVFVLLLTVVDTIVSLPFNLYGTFVVEDRHGFNKSTVALFFQDKVMTLGLTLLLGTKCKHAPPIIPSSHHPPYRIHKHPTTIHLHVHIHPLIHTHTHTHTHTYTYTHTLIHIHIHIHPHTT